MFSSFHSFVIHSLSFLFPWLSPFPFHTIPSTSKTAFVPWHKDNSVSLAFNWILTRTYHMSQCAYFLWHNLISGVSVTFDPSLFTELQVQRFYRMYRFFIFFINTSTRHQIASSPLASTKTIGFSSHFSRTICLNFLLKANIRYHLQRDLPRSLSVFKRNPFLSHSFCFNNFESDWVFSLDSINIPWTCLCLLRLHAMDVFLFTRRFHVRWILSKVLAMVFISVEGLFTSLFTWIAMKSC